MVGIVAKSPRYGLCYSYFLRVRKSTFSAICPQRAVFMYFVSMFLRILAAPLLACRGGIVTFYGFIVTFYGLVLLFTGAIHS